MNDETKTPYDFGYILARERSMRNISLKELSNLLGKDEEGKYLLSPSYLSRLEKNEADNPGFRNVCLLMDKLGLDLREVLKSFSYEKIADTYKEGDLDNIKEILRLYNVKAPSYPYTGELLGEEHLDFNEKELLISMILNIFCLGTCPEEQILFHIIEIISKVGEYRSIREEKYRSRSYYYSDIPGTHLKIYIHETVKNQALKLYKEESEIIDIIRKYERYVSHNIDGDYSLVIENEYAVINFTKDDNLITINSITFNVLHYPT